MDVGPSSDPRRLAPGRVRAPRGTGPCARERATVREIAAGAVLLRQRAVVTDLIVLLSGRIATLVDFAGVGELVVETTEEPGRVFGWSGLHAPGRATATVRADADSRVVTLPLAPLLDGPPRWTAALCALVAGTLADRTRELQVRWSGAAERRVRRCVTPPRSAAGSPAWPCSTSSTTPTWTCSPTTRRGSRAAGERLHADGQDGAALWFLVDGEIVLGPPCGAVDGVVRRVISTPGYPVGWDGVVWPGRHRWDAVAAIPRPAPAGSACGDRRPLPLDEAFAARLSPAAAVAGRRTTPAPAHPPGHRPLRRRDRRGRRVHRLPRRRAAGDLGAAPHSGLPALTPDRRRRVPGARGDP